MAAMMMPPASPSSSFFMAGSVRRSAPRRRPSELPVSRAFRPQGRFGPERPYDFLVGLDVGSADQVDAIGHCGENARHQRPAFGVPCAFERLADGLGLSRQVDDQALLADHRD